MNTFDFFSPTDYRYAVEKLKPYLSEEAFVDYKSRVESELAYTLADWGVCSRSIADEIDQAIRQVTAEEVYKEEDRIHHDVRAQANMIRKRVSDAAKPFVHNPATSYDIVEPANIKRYRDATFEVIFPDMAAFEKSLIELAKRGMEDVQIGRTHGQHAEPITFGFAMAQYVSRWGNRMMKVLDAADSLVGKFSGAVGAYNASSLFICDPEKFEEDVLKRLDLEPAEISTQIVPPEPLTDFAHYVVSSFGVLANFARDMRNLQRSEIGEVGEPFGREQVGSSTMPHKRNPINFENVESAWKEFMPRMTTVYLDQVSEHQRDLTNSLSSRYFPELLVMFDSSIIRMNKITNKLNVNKEMMRRNFEMNADKIIAEPLYILLAYYGHPDAHEYVRKLTQKSEIERKPLTKIVLEDDGLKPYLAKFEQKQIEILKDPSKYLGIAKEKAQKVINNWEGKINNLKATYPHRPL